MRLEGEFEEFLDKTVNLSKGRLKKLGDRSAAVESVLRGSTDPNLVVADARPQGSFAQKTIINPHDDVRGFDADLLVELEDHIREPGDLLRAVKDVLKASARHADLVHAKKRCITLDYAGEFHLDVVPCVRAGGTLYIANRETGGWEPTDPDGFNSWLEERDGHARDHLVPGIRLCKFLRDYKGRPSIKSVILTTLLALQVERRSSGDFKDVPTTLVLVLEDLAAWCGTKPAAPTLQEPTCSAELRLNDTDWGAFTRQIASLARRVRAAYDEPDEAKSLALWRDLFGKRFPAPATRLVEASLDAGEKDLYRDFGIPTMITDSVVIDGRVRPKQGFRAGPIASLLPLQRERKLVFKLASTTVQEPYDVYWKIKNRGSAAAAANALRGEIRRDDKGSSAWREESTLYPGKHYVDIHILKDSICVATAREDVIIR